MEAARCELGDTPNWPVENSAKEREKDGARDSYKNVLEALPFNSDFEIE